MSSKRQAPSARDPLAKETASGRSRCHGPPSRDRDGSQARNGNADDQLTGTKEPTRQAAKVRPMRVSCAAAGGCCPRDQSNPTAPVRPKPALPVTRAAPTGQPKRDVPSLAGTERMIPRHTARPIRKVPANGPGPSRMKGACQAHQCKPAQHTPRLVTTAWVQRRATHNMLLDRRIHTTEGTSPQSSSEEVNMPRHLAHRLPMLELAPVVHLLSPQAVGADVSDSAERRCRSNISRPGRHTPNSLPQRNHTNQRPRLRPALPRTTRPPPS